MDIQSAKYGANEGENVCVVVTNSKGEKIFVPLDPDNTDYSYILEWAKEDGNTIQDAD
tara:strand:- start:771 stop:944 length:174 start_codon:yes stop_codon:yes gene_type:complete